jgi:hypothetical protein
MRLAATLGASLKKLLEQEVRAGERAVTRGVRSETERLKREVRQQVVAAFGARGRGIANAWRARMTVTLHETYLALAKTPIQGPVGIEAAFELRAAFNAAAGRMMTVTLRNGVASYA